PCQAAGRRQERAQSRPPPFLQALRQRPLHLRSALAEMGLPARLGHRHAAAEAEGAGAHHDRLQGRVGGGARRQGQPQVRPVSRPVDRGLAQDARALREMTPFGRRMRELRAARGLRMKDMATALNVSSAYLSALEHGNRGRPSSGFVQQISAYFNLAWDDVDELKRLAELSHPRIVVDTAGLSPNATELANRLAEAIGGLSEATIDRLLDAIEAESG